MKKNIKIAPYLILLGLVLLPACTSNTSNESNNGAPKYSGPYAAELASAWQESDSDFVREVIADEKISDQEWSETGTRMTECLAAKGLKFEGFNDEGGYRVGPTSVSDPDKIMDDCETDTGAFWLLKLRIGMMSNPSNEPIEEIMTECLIRNGAVDSSYTKEQYLQDNPSLGFPFMGTDKESIFWSCTDNPSFTVQSQ